MLEGHLHNRLLFVIVPWTRGSYHAPAQRLICAGQHCSESELTVTRKGGRVYLRRLKVTLKPSWLLSREELPRTLDSFSKNAVRSSLYSCSVATADQARTRKPHSNLTSIHSLGILRSLSGPFLYHWVPAEVNRAKVRRGESSHFEGYYRDAQSPKVVGA